MAEKFDSESEFVFALITSFYPTESPTLGSILGPAPRSQSLDSLPLPIELQAAVNLQHPELSFPSRHICTPYFDVRPHHDPKRIRLRHYSHLPPPDRGLRATTTLRCARVAAAPVHFAPAKADPCCTAPMLPSHRFATPLLPAPPPLHGGGAKADSRRLSAQSLAARTRRERISRRMKELGRLIPGGSRMTSADMLTAGFAYVTFMQAQVGILRVIGSLRHRRVSPEVEQKLGVLVASAAFQEKLARAEHCVVPVEGISAMYNDEAVKSEPSIVRELDRLLVSTLI